MKSRTIFRPRFTPVVEPRGGHVGVAKPFLHLALDSEYTVSFDPLTFEAMVALFTMVAMAAGYFPARRASLVDPMEALRRSQ
jgi:ABC-type lipoprotein release transport system permease subunit